MCLTEKLMGFKCCIKELEPKQFKWPFVFSSYYYFPATSSPTNEKSSNGNVYY